jgi:hypothetical protein
MSVCSHCGTEFKRDHSAFFKRSARQQPPSCKSGHENSRLNKKCPVAWTGQIEDFNSEKSSTRRLAAQT